MIERIAGRSCNSSVCADLAGRNGKYYATERSVALSVSSKSVEHDPAPQFSVAQILEFNGMRTGVFLAHLLSHPVRPTYKMQIVAGRCAKNDEQVEPKRSATSRRPGGFQSGQTAKARSGLPCAVTPLRDGAAGSVERPG